MSTSHAPTQSEPSTWMMTVLQLTLFALFVSLSLLLIIPSIALLSAKQELSSIKPPEPPAVPQAFPTKETAALYTAQSSVYQQNVAKYKLLVEASKTLTYQEKYEAVAEKVSSVLQVMLKTLLAFAFVKVSARMVTDVVGIWRNSSGGRADEPSSE